MTVAGREWLVAVAPLGDGIGMTMLRYADELRDLADFFEDVPGDKPDKEMVDLAVELIERKSGSFKPDEFENHYHTALKELVDEKLKGHKVRAPEEKSAAGRQGDRPHGRPEEKHRRGASEGEGQNRCAREPASGLRRQKALGAALITKLQRKALLFIEAEMERTGGIAPSVRELADHFHYRSPTMARRLLMASRSAGSSDVCRQGIGRSRW